MRWILVAMVVVGCAEEREQAVPLDCPGWEPEMKALAQERCVGCHAELGAYGGVLAVQAGLLDALGDENHAGEDRATWSRWVVDCRLSYRDSRLHGGGLMNPADPGFHAALLRDGNWDLASCQTCHAGAAPRCETCHADGPTGCTTCHAKQDAPHAAHAFACGECHRVPERWDAPGHIVDDAPPAEVVLAAQQTSPTYDPATRTCSEVYCHGATLGGTSPSWGGPPQTCASCHPRATHVSPLPCASCHAEDRHLDGVLDVGAGCSDCHTADAPHRAHLEADALRGPIACSACHLVPEVVTSPGHLDAVAGAEVVLDGTWDPAERRCSDSYCHGGFAPAWDRLDDGQAACGTCHGIPPASHAPAPLGDCHTCHPGVNEFGGIAVPGTHLDGVVDVRP